MASDSSLPCEAEYIDDDIIVFEWVLLAEVSVVLRVPEAAGAHVEAGVAALQDDHVGHELEVLVHLLQHFYDDLAHVIAPFLSVLRVVRARLERLEDEVVDLVLNLLV